MDRKLLDLYVDYLISSFSYTTAVGLSKATEGKVSHDKITRFLRNENFTSKLLWKLVKPTVLEVENPDGVLIVDDTIEEKPSTDENDIVSWHHDHSRGQYVKGINIVSTLYYSNGVRIPVAYTLIHKTKMVVDEKTGLPKRISETSKNEDYREMLRACAKNNIKFRYVLNDVWFGSKENMSFVKKTLKKDFVMPVKSNRMVAINKSDKAAGKFVSVEDLKIKKGAVVKIYVKGLSFPVILSRQIFKNEDGSEGTLYLVSSDLTLTKQTMLAIYHKRWKVEEYHKSLKQHVSLCKSPTKTVRTQSNHIFAAIYAFCKFECISCLAKINQTALKMRLYMKALMATQLELKNLKHEYSMRF
jgi:hypothetical protein